MPRPVDGVLRGAWVNVLKKVRTSRGWQLCPVVREANGRLRDRVWLSFDEIATEVELLDEMILVDHFTIDYRLKAVGKLRTSQYSLHILDFKLARSPVNRRVAFSRRYRLAERDKPNFVGGTGPVTALLGGANIEVPVTAWNTPVKDLIRKDFFRRDRETRDRKRGRA